MKKTQTKPDTKVKKKKTDVSKEKKKVDVPTNPFTKADVKQSICKYLKGCVDADIKKNKTVESVGKRTAAEIFKRMEKKYQVGSSSVRRYLKELLTDNSIVISTRANEGISKVVNVYAYVPETPDETKPDKPVEKGTESDLKPSNNTKKTVCIDGECGYCPSCLFQGKYDSENVLCAECLVPHCKESRCAVESNAVDEELTVDENDTDTPPDVIDIPVRSERTKNPRIIKYTRCEAVLLVIRMGEFTPTEIIKTSNEISIENGGTDNIIKQTQVYKIVARTLLVLGGWSMDVLGVFRKK